MSAQKTNLKTKAFDNVSGCWPAINFEHHELHEGHHFHWDSSEVSLGAGANYYVLITTPNSPVLRCHMVADAICNAEFIFGFYETPTGVTGGSAGQGRNNKRGAGDSHLLAITAGVSIATPGTKLARHRVGDTTSPVQSTGGSSRDDSEWILAPNATYLIWVQLIAAGYANVDLQWYEHKHHDLLGI